MKVLMFSSGTAHSPLTHRAAAFGRQLIARGHEVAMVVPSADKYSKWKLDQPAELDGITMIYPFQFRTRSQILDLLPYIISATFIAAIRRTDVAYTLKTTPASLPALAAKWLHGARLVVDLDDLDAEVMQAQNQPAILAQLVAFCERIMTANASTLILASRLLMNEYKTRFPRKTLLRVSNGVTPSQFPLAHRQTDNAAPRIVFFGLLGRTRILAPLMEALPMVIAAVGADRVHVDIFGTGAKPGRIRSACGSNGVADAVKFHGWVTSVN